MRILRTLAVIATATTASLAIAATPGVSFAANSSDSGATAALSSVAGGLVQQAVPSATDADSAAQTATVDVPFDPTQGVTLKQGDNMTVVGLPDAQHLSRGVRQANGVVTYHNTNGSDAVVVPTSSGAQFLTVIENANAPADYAYPVTLPASSKVVVGSSGNAYILNANMQPTAIIPAPWAQGSGQAVATWFTTNGTNLVQHIAHKAGGTGYPVVADPSYRWYNTGVVITLNKTENGILAASLIFLPVVAGLASIGSIALSNKVMWKAGWFQAQAAWFALHGQCLWIWVPYIGDSDSGGYPCS